MKIGIHRDERALVLTEVYSSIILRTSEGNEFAICMRDDTVEMKVVNPPDGKCDHEQWHRANMITGEIKEMN